MFVEVIFFSGLQRARTSDMLVQVLRGMALEAPSFKVVEVQFSLKV